MRDTKCETVRHELEELMLGDECSMHATQHLRDCSDCREFHEKQTKLRQIVGSLGTIEAPPDFDFRLRARLANEAGSAGFHLRLVRWSFAGKGFAAAAAIVLFVVGVVYVRTVMKQEPAIEVAEHTATPSQPTPKPLENENIVQVPAPVVASNDGPRRVGGERRVSSRNKTQLVAVDSGVERPIVFSDSQPQSAIFPIDASLQSMKFSLDDGRGNARTISVPTISFGSQRVLPGSTNQLAQKGVGVW